MSDTAALITHCSNIILGERLAVGFLVIVLIGMITYREHRKSTIYLAIAIVIEIFRLLADSAAFAYDINGEGSLPLMQAVFFVSYTFGFLTLIAFSYYVRSFIQEKTTIRKWVFRVPVVLALLGFGILTMAILHGTVYAPVDGRLTTVGEPPVITQLLQLAIAGYYPCTAFSKRKEIGLRSVMLLGLFGILPTAVMFISFDYSMMFSAYSLTIVYILLQCDTSAQKEQQKQQLETLNSELAKANEEKLAQIEEISALNTQLEENQTRLEEASSEQEAQFAEVTALNSALQQANEAQRRNLDEIERLNALFRETQDHGIRSLLNQLIQNDGESAAIDRLIQTVGEYFHADRSYIFERDAAGQYTVNTYEWCAEGVCPEKDNLQQVPIHVVDPWMEEFRKKGSFFISCDDEYAGREPMVYEVLEPQGITSLMAAPMVVDGDIIGFMGVDNPRENLNHELYLAVAAGMINHECQLVQERLREEGYKQELEKAREAAEAANIAKTTFLFNMSHDIRTPMNAIIGFRDLLEKHQQDPRKRADYLRKMEDASNVLLSIINNVLEMARIEKGTLELEETAWGAEQFNDTVYSIFQELMEQKDIRFTRQIRVENPYVYGDTIKLREIFINILSNAYKYTNAGGSVNMLLEELPCSREGYALYRTTITDTGIGMSADFLPHIFEEFSRENNTTDNKIEGTGLGMPIVKRLLALMGGTIEVRSEKGVGSTFVVTIPHRIADRSALADRSAVLTDPELFRGRRILLAEDNDLNAEIATEILSEAGFTVDRAEDGVICCEKLSGAEPGYYSLILMDIQMPNRNGYEAARVIRQLPEPAKADIPILAMTANAFEEDRREAMRAGMNGHLAKPVDVPELMRTLADMLGQ